MFASRMKNLKSQNHYDHVQRVLKWLNLSQCEDVKIGRCSGGQVKRVCIGVELISNPDVLVLDEPTTGLDSSTAAQCIGNDGVIASTVMLRIARTAVKQSTTPAATVMCANDRIVDKEKKLFLLLAGLIILCARVD